MNLNRRRFIGCSAGTAATATLCTEWIWPNYSVSYKRRRSRVAILEAYNYSEKIEDLLFGGLRLFGLNAILFT